MVQVVGSPTVNGDGYGDGHGYGSGSGYGYGDGYGYGYGSGDGHGDGHGYGYGDGDGDGHGYGHGYGYGYGSGSGDGYGDGHGYGYGDGHGYGYGDGHGYGDGDGHGHGSWEQFIPAFAEKLTDAQRVRLSKLKSGGATIAYWCSDSHGKPCNGGRGVAVSPGHVDTETGPLQLCAAGTLHATHYPQKWKGERWWIVALIGDVVGDGEKFGALEREIIGEADFSSDA